MSVVTDRAEAALAAVAEDDDNLVESSESEEELLEEGGTTATAPSEPAEPEYVDDEPAESERQTEAEAPAETEHDEAPSWHEGVLGLALSYGISEDQLKEMSSEAEFNRYTRWIDQQYQAARQRQTSTQDTSETVADTSRAAGKQDAPAVQGIKDGLLDLEWINQKFEDEDTRAIFQGVNQALQARDEQLKQLAEQSQFYQTYIRQQEEVRATNEIHDAIDRYNADLYGNSGEMVNGMYKPLPEPVAKMRAEVIEVLQDVVLPAVENQAARNPNYQRPSTAVLVERAARLVHAEQLDRLANQKKAATLKTQSSKRRTVVQPSSTSKVPLRTKASEGPQTLDEEAEEIANDPEVKGLYHRFQEENGALA